MTMNKMKNASVVVHAVLFVFLGFCFCCHSTEGLQLVHPPPSPPMTSRKSRQQQPLSYSANNIAADPSGADDGVPSNPLAQLVSKLHDPQIRFRVVRWPTLSSSPLPSRITTITTTRDGSGNELQTKQGVEEVVNGNYFQVGQEAAMKAIQDVMAQYNIGTGGEQKQQHPHDGDVVEECNFLQKGQEAAMKAIREAMALYENSNSSIDSEGKSKKESHDAALPLPRRPVAAMFRILQRKKEQL